MRQRPVDALPEIDRLVDEGALERLLDPVQRLARGEASYLPLLMFKALLLQRGHGLSDPGLESALSDRLNFLRVCGLTLDRMPTTRPSGASERRLWRTS